MFELTPRQAGGERRGVSQPGARAPAAAESLHRRTSAGVLALQRAAGNRAVGALLRERRSPAPRGACRGGPGKTGADGGTGVLDAGSAAPATGGGGGAAAIKKTVNVYPVSLGSSTRDPYVDIKRADAIWSQCGVKINARIGQCSTSKVLDTLDPKNVLNEYSDPASPTTEETAMLALRPGWSSDLHAYYVPRMSAGSRGEAFWPAVSKTSAVVISDSAASDSLAHEIGHVLLDDGTHNEVDPDDLMASGSIRNVGVDKLSATQCAKAVK